MKPTKYEKRLTRHKRVKAKIKGTKEIPRVSIFKSNQHIFVQFIDDSAGKTILSNTIKPLAKSGKGNKTETASLIGETLSQKAKAAGISKIIFDRGGFKYHGRVKALAESLRKGGLIF